MPEIAEVETVRNTLKKRILGKKIKKVDVYYEPMLLDDKDYFCSSLINQSFIDIKRRGNGCFLKQKNIFY